jgi:TatD DNase family protein
LSTRRGREYARVLPADRLLLETDLPPESDAAFALDVWEADIREALTQLESIRGEAMASRLADTSIQLLNA